MFYTREGNEVVIENRIDGTDKYPFEGGIYHYSYRGRLYEVSDVNSKKDIKSFKGKVSFEQYKQILQFAGFREEDYTKLSIPRRHFQKFVEIVNS